MIKNLLRENLVKHQIYEVLRVYEGEKDAEGNELDFVDASANCISPKAIVKWLNDELNRLDSNKLVKAKDKVKRKQAKVKTKNVADVIVTGGNIRAVKDDDLDKYIENFKKYISVEPEIIIDANPKMIKTDAGLPQATVNTGLPALVGIIWDIRDNTFKAISSCPGAGSCAVGCYARKAFYLMDDDKTIKLARRLNFLWNHPKQYEERIMEELRPTCEELKRSSIGFKDKLQLVIRWNDAGDFFSKKYVEIAVNVTKRLLSEGYNVKSYAYTKSGEHAITLDNVDNFIVNFSTDAHSDQTKIVNAYDTENKMKRAENVPKEVFKKYLVPKGSSYALGSQGMPLFAYEEASNDLKDAIFNKYSDKYHFDRDSLVYTFELPNKPDPEQNKYNVIVLPTRDKDIAAQRKDVKMSFLLQH